MNKLTFLLIATTFMILTTLVVNSLGLSDVESPVSSLPGDFDNSVGSLLGILGTFVDLLTFRLDGIPTLFNLVFVVVAVGVLYVIVEWLVNLVPFT